MEENDLRPALENIGERNEIISEEITDDRESHNGPTEMVDSKKNNIIIYSLDFGYNVKIGCQNFAIEGVERLIKNLEAYLNDPRGTEKTWMKERKLL